MGAVRMSTIFGGDTGMSYEDVQRKRKIAEALLAQNMRTPQSLPEGLNAIGRALAARSIEKKTGKAMEGLNAEADALFSSIFGGGSSAGGGASYPTSPAPIPKVETSTEGEAIADDAMATLVRMGLVERGLPEHVADGFVMNAKDESGLRTDINEIAPLVPGSRGGFGLMQWTGPRRVALEQEAARRGVDPSDLQLQLDTIVSEMQGPEARAGQSILSTKDAPSAATAIVNDYLRPAPQHRASRAAAYSGGGSVGGSAGGSPSVQQIAAALSNPIISNDPGKMAILNAMLGQAMKVSEPVRGVTMGDRLVNPMTGEVIADFTGAPGSGDDFRTQSSEILPNGTTVIVGRNGGVLVRGPDGRELTGQEAAAAIDEGQRMRAEYERGVYGARREGQNEAEAATGAAAAAAGAAGEQAVDMSGEAWNSALAIGRSNSTIDEAIAAIDGGARSGAIDRYLPNVSEASASLENAMNRLGLDVISATTFGALSEGEMRLAMETAVPRNLNEADLRAWLVRKREANAKAQDMLIDAARFLGTPGNTLAMWIDKNRSASNSNAGTNTTGAAGAVTHRFNPATGKIEAVQ